jgi:3-deoxy-D-manno-octulosonate 8-phosphate phosphatase (KDO 8-P phosphatase)
MDPLHERARRIRLLVLDVDGVLTDGRLHYGPSGEELKVFHVRDGAGLVALQRAGVTVAIVSGRNSAAVDRRAAELGIRLVRQGAADKAHELETLASRLGTTREEMACVGDDTPDLPMMRRAALAIAVADAHADVIAAADWVTTRKGGRGAVREVCDLLLRARQAPGSA